MAARVRSGRRGRPSRYAKFDDLLGNLPTRMSKRPHYVDGIGLFRGAKHVTAWVKIRLRRGGTFRGRSYQPGSAVEINLGHKSSWSWEQLEAEFLRLQGLADRGEALEQATLPTFREWATDWLARARGRLKSYEIVKIHVEKQLVPTFGDKSLADLSVTEINHWISRRLKQTGPGPNVGEGAKRSAIKPATVKRELDTLKAIMSDAVKAGHIAVSPCTNAAAIKGVVGRQRFLSAEEITTLVSAADVVEPWLGDFVLWCIHSGMRRGEVLGLTWAKVQEVGDDTVVLIDKTKTDQPLFFVCTSTMKQILVRQRERIAAGSKVVFPVTAITLRRRWEEARKNAGLPDVTIHDLRRTHSTYAAAAGVDLRTLAARIGHKNLDMLEKRYAAITGTGSREAAKKIEATFDQMISESRPR